MNPKKLFRYAVAPLLIAVFLASSLAPAISQAQDVGGVDPSGGASGSVSCSGSLYNPITDLNWNNIFPITIMGFAIGSNGEPPIVDEPPICFCPSRLFGITVPGIGITYWEPLYVAEITKSPGCLITVGGQEVLGGFKNQQGPSSGVAGKSGSAGTNADRSQVHWYVYPVFGMINVMISSVCMNTSMGFNVAGLTEINPLWQDDIWSQVFTPESGLFASLPMQAACMVDAVASSVSYPMDPLFWCAGSWGSVYPLSGNPNSKSSDQQSNALELAKYIAFQARTGLMLTTVGPKAQCFSTYSPIWVKSQFRVDPIWPLPNTQNTIYMGQTPLRWGYMPPHNFPKKQDSAYGIWNGSQCCLRP